MRRTMHKVFLAWEFDKEERWLNEMSAKGLALESAGSLTYQFRDCDPGEYAVRLELLEELPEHPDSQRYIQFVEETGAEYLGHCLRWVYFRKRTDRGEFELFSDLDSRIRHVGRILTLMSVLLCIMIGMLGINLSIFLLRGAAFTLGVCLPLAVVSVGFALGLTQLLRLRARLRRERELHD